MNSSIFFSDRYIEFQESVKTLLNTSPDFLSKGTAQSTRAVGDAVERIVANSFEELLGDVCSEYSSQFERRAMADIAFTDTDGLYYVIDVKTHRTDTKFNMPNLTSVQRLSKLYENDDKYFVLLMVSYTIEETRAIVSAVRFVPIEFIGWDCLTLGALGWGQIQISNSNRVTVNPGYSRKQWMIELCDAVLQFYPKEISKIGQRIDYFEKIRDHWLLKQDEASLNDSK